MTHSPGPWKVRISHDSTRGELLVVDTYRGNQCIDCTDTGTDSAESLANAHLIAKAPELKAMLERLLAAFNYQVIVGGGDPDVSHIVDPVKQLLAEAEPQLTAARREKEMSK